MSCVVGIVQKGVVYIGGDSASSDSYTIITSGDKKVFKRKGILFGCTGSPRAKQLLRHSLVIPMKPNSMRDEDFLRTVFIESVRECFREGGFARSENSEEFGSHFLVGYNGTLFEVGSDYQVTKPADQVASIGSGCEVAYGSLHTSTSYSPQKRFRKALLAAAYYNPFVRAPFVVQKL